ncbi:MAG: M23 family metallopeptidase [Niastella sp.]|nr:M23 family metallopeptidase [Niastella sp.]
MKVKRIIKYVSLFLLVIIIIGYCLPQHYVMPVAGANSKSYDDKSFWFYPWGKSVTHKGVDIFGKKGTPVVAATAGLVVYTGVLKRGGNVAVVLGPKWRFHYYAHLQDTHTSTFSFVKAGSPIGTVGNTGNAASKPSHLHYTMSSMIPLPWRIDKSKQGWKKMWYLDPIPYLKETE